MNVSGKRMKRAVSVILAGMLLMTGCAGKDWLAELGFEDKKECTLSFSGDQNEAEDVEIIEGIAADYRENHPETNVSYESFSGDDYFEALRDKESSGNLDDIFVVDQDTAAEFSENGSLEELTDLVKDVPFPDSILEQMEVTRHKIYWVPATVSAFGLYCNMDLLEEHNQKVPEKLEEWVDTCEYFVFRRITPVLTDNDISLKTMAIAKAFYPLYKNGVEERKIEKVNRGEKQFSEYMERGFTLVKDFCTRGYIDRKKALETDDMSDVIEEFVKGESPFMLADVSAAETVKEMNPGFEFKVVPYPVLEEGSVLVVNPENRLGISAEGEHKERAKEFVKYLLKEENLGKIADNQTALVPLEGNFKPSLMELQDIAESFQTQTTVIGNDTAAEFPIWDITAEASKKLLEGEEIEELMSWMDAQVSAAVQ